MSAKRLMAIILIYGCTAVAWFLLGSSVFERTGEFDQKLAQDVARLWGGRHVQAAPAASVERPRETVESIQETDAQRGTVTRQVTRTILEKAPLALSSSRLKVGLTLDQRRRGLLWYDTYGVAFEGRYRLRNPDDVPRTVHVQFGFPSKEAIYDAFTFRVGGKDVPFSGDLSGGVLAEVVLPPSGEADIEGVYRSRGLGDWIYAFAPAGVAQVKDFAMEMTTDFDGIDFPSGTISPVSREAAGKGWRLSWVFDSLITAQQIGMAPPDPIDPGPLAARITFFAPVSLLFFMTVMVIQGILSGRSLHPMNYFFLAAAFFSFHLLLAYLADHINIHASFIISAGASLTLVITYLRLVSGMRLDLLGAGFAQLVFLVLFSYALFFEGYAGLTVTVGAVITLFVLMQVTGRVNWESVFGPARKDPTGADA
jgi:hypothetical protein